MKKIINPWKGLEGYNCFGCAPNNEAGVKMEFYEDGDEVVSIWKPRPEYQGWIDTLHGGIQSVLLDEICAWVILRKLQTTGVTSKMETRYRKSISTKDSHVVLRASIREIKRNIVFLFIIYIFTFFIQHRNVVYELHPCLPIAIFIIIIVSFRTIFRSASNTVLPSTRPCSS